MSAIVIDTNVLLVADGQAPQMSDACKQLCFTRLERVKSKEQVVIDEGFLILGEYQKNLSLRKSPPSPGSAFLIWLMQHQAMPRHVARVRLTPRDREQTLFAEFPPDEELCEKFDPADRKFVAAAHAHPEKPPILEAADSKWLVWENDLAPHGIRLEVICRNELEAIRRRKTD